MVPHHTPHSTKLSTVEKTKSYNYYGNFVTYINLSCVGLILVGGGCRSCDSCSGPRPNNPSFCLAKFDDEGHFIHHEKHNFPHCLFFDFGYIRKSVHYHVIKSIPAECTYHTPYSPSLVLASGSTRRYGTIIWYRSSSVSRRRLFSAFVIMIASVLCAETKVW